MRNIVEYPITKEEITNYMEQLIEEFQKDELCPDMRVVLLGEALKIVKNSDYPNATDDLKTEVLSQDDRGWIARITVGDVSQTVRVRSISALPDFRETVNRVVQDGTYSQAAADRFLHNVLGFQD